MSFPDGYVYALLITNICGRVLAGTMRKWAGLGSLVTSTCKDSKALSNS